MGKSDRELLENEYRHRACVHCRIKHCCLFSCSMGITPLSMPVQKTLTKEMSSKVELHRLHYQHELLPTQLQQLLGPQRRRHARSRQPRTNLPRIPLTFRPLGRHEEPPNHQRRPHQPGARIHRHSKKRVPHRLQPGRRVRGPSHAV